MDRLTKPTDKPTDRFTAFHLSFPRSILQTWICKVTNNYTIELPVWIGRRWEHIVQITEFNKSLLNCFRYMGIVPHVRSTKSKWISGVDKARSFTRQHRLGTGRQGQYKVQIAFCQKCQKRDGQNNRPTDKVTYRVTCTRLKQGRIHESIICVWVGRGSDAVLVAFQWKF